MQRIGVIVGMWLACGLLIAVMVQAGRILPTPLVFAQIGGAGPEHLRYMLVDAQRGLTLIRQIAMPSGYDITWQDGAVVLLELGRRLEMADWTFSVLDTVTGERQPVMRVTTANTVQMRLTEFDLHHGADGDYGTLYIPFTGDVWVSSPDAPNAVKLATVTRGLTQPLAWSPDRTTLAIKAEQVVVMHLIGADGVDRGPLTVPRTTAITWSPDSRTILLNPVDPRLAEREGGALVDAATGAIIPLPGIRYGAWCGTLFAAAQIDGAITLRDTSGVVVETLAPAGTFTDPPVTSIEPLDNSCSRIVIRTGFLVGSSLLMRGAGAPIPLGPELRVIHASDTALTYQTRVNENLTIRRIRYDAPDTPETLAAYPRLYVPIAWLPGGERGVALDFRTLTLFDIARNAAVALSDQIVLGLTVIAP